MSFLARSERTLAAQKEKSLPRPKGEEEWPPSWAEPRASTGHGHLSIGMSSRVRVGRPPQIPHSFVPNTQKSESPKVRIPSPQSNKPLSEGHRDAFVIHRRPQWSASN